MIYYLTHPQHGSHVAYSEDEVARCKASGWVERGAAASPPPAPQLAQVSAAVVATGKRRPGRPYKTFPPKGA